ncbi:MAG: phenylalanine--tRNA ligase subunit alpha [Planctomycetes bacterium]|nr:phenylalanine--tRNA ligase subunit alpha [Planctomycetota bacterium]
MDAAGVNDPLAVVAAAGDECRARIRAAESAEALASARSAALGREGRLQALMELLKSAAREVRPALGVALNALKNELTELAAERALALGSVASGVVSEDITLPPTTLSRGSLHPLTRTERRVVQVLKGLGFSVTDGPEVEDEFHNFVALNIPPSHPAREPADNFYLAGVPYLLRSQTSTVQIRTMETQQLPLRVCAPGRVFRPDEVDATHHYMFHQVEGLAVDEGLSMADLKGTLLLFFRGLFGADVELRLRPSFFPFTEPSAEVDVRFPGRGWVEIGGCGMVNPAVFAAVGIDANRWSGFAFGLGLERLAMRHCSVPDIRHFTENDVRFLRQLA